jgi:hypothetical protein
VLREQVHFRHISNAPFVDRGPDRNWRDDEQGLTLEDLEDSLQLSNRVVEKKKLNIVESYVEPSNIDTEYSPKVVQGLA